PRTRPIMTKLPSSKTPSNKTAPAPRTRKKTTAVKPAKADPTPKADPTVKAKTAPTSPPPADHGASPPSGAVKTFDAGVLKQMEEISLNVAKAALTAQTALAAALTKQSGPDALSGSMDPFEAGPALNDVVTSLASKPDK